MADIVSFEQPLVSRMANVIRADARLTPLPQPSVISVRVRQGAQPTFAHTLGVDALPAPNRVISTALGDCAWVRPDEWLILGALDARQTTRAMLEQNISSESGAVVDISGSRVALELCGARSREILASVCPLDLHPRAFVVGQCAQSLIAKSPVFLQMANDAPTWRLLVRPSFASYVVSWLTDAMLGG